MYSKYLLIMVHDLNGKGKQDLQLLILTKFVLHILEEQEKTCVSYNHSFKCSGIRFMHKKHPKYVTASVFLLGICVQNVIWFTGIPVYPSEFFLHLNKETIKWYFNVRVWRKMTETGFCEVSLHK